MYIFNLAGYCAPGCNIICNVAPGCFHICFASHRCSVRGTLTPRCRQSATRKVPTAGALATRGLTGRGFTCAYRVLGVVHMQHRFNVTHPDKSSGWPAELEALIRTEWPSALVGPGLAYSRDIRHVVQCGHGKSRGKIA